MSGEANRPILVIGGGISGMRAALDLATVGCRVILVEKQGATGGWLSMLDHQFPTNGCGMCRILPHTVAEVGDQQCLRKGLAHPKIEIVKGARILEATSGSDGFTVRLRQPPPAVDPSACMGCGWCAEVCPVEVSDAFNCGLSKKKAIHPPIPHSWPARFVIDSAVCNRCGACIEVCPTGAIRLPGSVWGDFRVLVVDDEAIVRDSTRDWLMEEGGFVVDTAESGLDAIALLQQGAYHLMLLDIKMPGMDGVDVLRKAKEIRPDLVVIMMTAYATVETAVDAMKIGALDYLVKPFDPEALLPKVEAEARRHLAETDRRLEVGAVVLATGCSLFDPAPGKNPFGYGIIPGVVTSIEFERILSGTGPTAGNLVRVEDGRPVRNIAWLQCVGSRDLQMEADFCSSVCCMISLKQALLAKERLGADGVASVFYMDMRTSEKGGQAYREAAEAAGIRLIRARIHSLIHDPETGRIVLRWVDDCGATITEQMDMVVLAVGQRPSEDVEHLAAVFGFSRNAAGFPEVGAFDIGATTRNQVWIAGAASGLASIRTSLISASAAACEVLGAQGYRIDAAGMGVAKAAGEERLGAVARQAPRIGVLLFCGEDRMLHQIDRGVIEARLREQPDVVWVGWGGKESEVWARNSGGSSQKSGNGGQKTTAIEAVLAEVSAAGVNRLLVGTGPLDVPSETRRLFADISQLPEVLVDVVDIHTPVLRRLVGDASADLGLAAAEMVRSIRLGISRLRWVTPELRRADAGVSRALVVGAGVAGMTAALSLARFGVHVDLVEKSDRLGGRANDIDRTIDGASVREFREGLIRAVMEHPSITCRTGTRVVACSGRAGCFRIVLEQADQGIVEEAAGAVILATGIRETDPSLCGYPKADGIVSQLAFERFLADPACDLSGIDTVVMIQCAGTRQDPRNYCSRVCCATTLKHAMALKARKPDIDVFVLYRDMMAVGSAESVYTQARMAGVVFLSYEPEQRPTVHPTTDGRLLVRTFERIVGREIDIEADRVVLASGMVPEADDGLREIFGISRDEHGFFREADIKWHPVRSEREGIFIAGAAIAPASIPEAVATARACAIQALPYLLPTSHRAWIRPTASVRHSLCSLCEQCVTACPFHARSIDWDIDRIVVDPMACRACGICAAVCPNDAAVVEGLLVQQLFETIEEGL
ncbi:MAG: response regulator [Thermodesulfobacteriota bacterium]